MPTIYDCDPSELVERTAEELKKMILNGKFQLEKPTGKLEFFESVK